MSSRILRFASQEILLRKMSYIFSDELLDGRVVVTT